MIDRRTFLLSVGAYSISPGVPAAKAEPELIVAKKSKIQLAPDGYPQTEVWAYNGRVPGEILRIRQGGRIVRRLENQLDDPTTIHWHGIRIDNAMDGVSDLTQAPVGSGEGFLYDFVVPDAGTFWFHPHRNTLEQVSRGLSAPLIVDEPDQPDIDDDIVLMINDWRLDPDAQVIDDFANMMDRSHAGRIGNYLTVNGLAEYVRASKRNERLRLRVINASSDRVIRLGGKELNAHIVALDGMPLRAPLHLDGMDLAPAQRVDLFADIVAEPGETAFLTSEERGGTYSLATFPVSADGAAVPRDYLKPLPPNDLPEPQLADAIATELVMEGGAMGGMMSGVMHRNRMMGMRDLMSKGLVWAFNGVAGMPDAPLLRADRHQTVRITLDNRTAFSHAMHLHGHHFSEMMPEGLGPARDTILVGARSSKEIAFVADNPGKWMFHCHMLAHQAAGMATWIEVGS
ncbi:MAG: multicopper oxidase family protein [Rhizobiaceae bacterium]